MVELLVIPDGVSPGMWAAARMPVLDRLASAGRTRLVQTVPSGLPAGSETCIPTLLGCPPAAPVGRGRVDAAAYGVSVAPGLIPWRADAVTGDGSRAGAERARAVADEIGAVATAGHRMLLLSATRPAPRADVRVWEDGPAPSGRLEPATAIVCAIGAAAGIGRLLGAQVIVPAGATGEIDTDLPAKARAAIAAAREGWPRVVVHVGGTDEAAHRRRPDQVVEMLERIDGQLLAPLRDHVRAAGGTLTVCTDHGTDPATGRHESEPVTSVSWRVGRTHAGGGAAAVGSRRERSAS